MFLHVFIVYVHALNQSIKGVESKGWATWSWPWTPFAVECSSTTAIADATKMTTVSFKKLQSNERYFC